MSDSYFAVRLLLNGDLALWEIVRLSVFVSLSSTLLALICGLPLGALIALRRFPGREPVVTF
jgi:tungstate transport system permease protein